MQRIHANDMCEIIVCGDTAKGDIQEVVWLFVKKKHKSMDETKKKTRKLITPCHASFGFYIIYFMSPKVISVITVNTFTGLSRRVTNHWQNAIWLQRLNIGCSTRTIDLQRALAQCSVCLFIYICHINVYKIICSSLFLNYSIMKKITSVNDNIRPKNKNAYLDAIKG